MSEFVYYGVLRVTTSKLTRAEELDFTKAAEAVIQKRADARKEDQQETLARGLETLLASLVTRKVEVRDVPTDKQPDPAWREVTEPTTVTLPPTQLFALTETQRAFGMALSSADTLEVPWPVTPDAFDDLPSDLATPWLQVAYGDNQAFDINHFLAVANQRAANQRATKTKTKAKAEQTDGGGTSGDTPVDGPPTE